MSVNILHDLVTVSCKDISSGLSNDVCDWNPRKAMEPSVETTPSNVTNPSCDVVQSIYLLPKDTQPGNRKVETNSLPNCLTEADDVDTVNHIFIDKPGTIESLSLENNSRRTLCENPEGLSDDKCLLSRKKAKNTVSQHVKIIPLRRKSGDQENSSSSVDVFPYFKYQELMDTDICNLNDKENMNAEEGKSKDEPKVAYVVLHHLQKPPKDYLWFSLFAFLCCCPPLGLCALVFSYRVITALKFGDEEAAKYASKQAKGFATTAALSGLILLLLAIVFLVR
ncbi:uncharacterized protein LOC144436925 [Glandiceps talaboti]